VVEPDARLLTATCDALDAAGLLAVRVRDGRGALAHEALASVSAVVSVLEMPRFDGLELLLALRAAPATRALPVVLLTGRVADEARELGARFGADAVLPRPPPPADLAATLRALCGLG
jgi:DNA-binding response OmpR family regulator